MERDQVAEGRALLAGGVAPPGCGAGAGRQAALLHCVCCEPGAASSNRHSHTAPRALARLQGEQNVVEEGNVPKRQQALMLREELLMQQLSQVGGPCSTGQGGAAAALRLLA